MKVYKLLIFLISIFVSINIFTSIAFAEQIDNYDVRLKVNQNGTIDVTETIDYDFGNLQKHGIFRDIPFTKTNSTNTKFEMAFKDILVTDKEGKKYTYEKTKSNEQISLKIGDANKTISGEHTYIVNYNVSGALTYFSDHDELYWNLLGTNWNVPVLNFRALITLPEEIPASEISSICYSGATGATTSDCTVDTRNNTVTITAQNLIAYQGVTGVISFPKGYVQVLEPEEYHLIDPLMKKVLLIVLAIAAIIYYLFLPVKLLLNVLKERSNLKNNAQIVAAWFDPPKDLDGNLFTPAETALLVDPHIDHKKITATIIHLAQRGYIKILHEKTTGLFSRDIVKLQKLKEFDNLNNYENDLLEGIFSADVSFLKSLKGLRVNIKIPTTLTSYSIGQNEDMEAESENIVDLAKLRHSTSFQSKYLKFFTHLGSSLKNKKLTDKTTKEIENYWGSLFGISIFVFNPFLLLVGILSRNYSKYTAEGVKQYGVARSLKNFLVSQDDNFDFQAKEKYFFERLLPYATAFGVEDVWIKRFPKIDLKDLDWYSSNTNTFALASLTNNIGSSFKMTSTSSSSGFSSGFSGGSSGGGGGGGGGGSW